MPYLFHGICIFFSRLQTSGNNSIIGNTSSSFGNCSEVAHTVNTSNCSNSSTNFAPCDMVSDPTEPKIMHNLVPLDCSVDANTHDKCANNDARMRQNKEQGCTPDFIFQPPHQHQLSSKRIKVADINVARYEEEFVEIEEIASGVFGKVMAARHRLDGMVYAIKVKFRPLI